MGGKLDGAALMRRVLGEQSPGEDIYAALERLVPSEHPQNAAKILQAIQHHLKLQQERFGNEPQRAAEFLAKSSAFLSFDSKGNPFLEAFFFEAKGFPNLSEPARSQFLEQMQKAIREGKPIAAEIVGPSEVKIQGLEELPQETRLEVLMQIKKAIEENKPFPQEIITQRVVKIQGSSCLTIVLFLLVMGALILAYLLSRH